MKPPSLSFQLINLIILSPNALVGKDAKGKFFIKFFHKKTKISSCEVAVASLNYFCFFKSSKGSNGLESCVVTVLF